MPWTVSEMIVSEMTVSEDLELWSALSGPVGQSPLLIDTQDLQLIYWPFPTGFIPVK